MKCDRCGDEADDLYCSGCGDVGHQSHPGECQWDKDEIGDVCSRCWAILSHVEGRIGCASGCTCRKDYPDIFSGVGSRRSVP